MKFLQNIFFLLVFVSISLAQEIDISNQLVEIENGNCENARKILSEYKKKEASDPSIIYLDALLTSNGSYAFDKFKLLYEKYPNSKYADAAMYGVYSYFYSTGNYISAKKILKEFKDTYPSSPYIKIAEGNLEMYSFPAANKVVALQEKETFELIYDFTVQAGAFLVPANALRLKKSFEDSGYLAEVKEKKIGGSNFSIVNIGRFQSEKEAEDFLPELREKFSITGRVVSSK